MDCPRPKILGAVTIPIRRPSVARSGLRIAHPGLVIVVPRPCGPYRSCGSRYSPLATRPCRCCCCRHSALATRRSALVLAPSAQYRSSWRWAAIELQPRRHARCAADPCFGESAKGDTVRRGFFWACPALTSCSATPPVDLGAGPAFSDAFTTNGLSVGFVQAPVPEPLMYLLFPAGFAFLVFAPRRRGAQVRSPSFAPPGLLHRTPPLGFAAGFRIASA